MKVKKVIGITLFALGVVGNLPLLFGVAALIIFRQEYYVEVAVGVELFAVALFVANIMCMAAGLYLINRAGDPRR